MGLISGLWFFVISLVGILYNKYNSMLSRHDQAIDDYSLEIERLKNSTKLLEEKCHIMDKRMDTDFHNVKQRAMESNKDLKDMMKANSDANRDMLMSVQSSIVGLQNNLNSFLRDYEFILQKVKQRELNT